MGLPGNRGLFLFDEFVGDMVGSILVSGATSALPACHFCIYEWGKDPEGEFPRRLR